MSNTRNFNFDIGWLGSDKCGWNAAPTCAQGKEKEKTKTLSSRHSFILQTKKGVLPTTAPPPFESLETPFRKFTPWKQLSSYLATQRMTTPKLKRIFPIGWAKRYFGFPQNRRWKSPNRLFGQPNILDFKRYRHQKRMQAIPSSIPTSSYL